MARTLLLAVAVALVAGLTTSARAGGDSGRVFVLERVDQGFAIEAVDLADDETKVFPVGAESGIVDIIMPVGPGVSGSMSRWKEGGTMSARCAAGGLQVTTRAANGKEWKRPGRKLDDLALYDVRVSVTAADGSKAAFLILQNERVIREKVGPVVDMFGGKIPMSEGDFTICTDTYLHTLGSHVAGEAGLTFDRWPLVTGKLPDGTDGTFIVDIGAGTTVVAKSLLPPETTITEAGMVQYSSGVRTMLDYAPGGATGTVDTILGHATLPELRLGTIRFADARVDVIKKMPDFYGRPIAGILGLDLMRRCDFLSMSLVADGDAAPTLRMADTPGEPSADAFTVPFTFVNSHLTVDGEVNRKPAHFIMDTGAPAIFLDAEAAQRVGVKAEADASRPARGLDGGTVDMTRGTEAELSIAGRSFGPIEPRVSALSCFVTMRTGGQNAGLLGNSFFSKFKRMELDFTRRVARFIE